MPTRRVERWKGIEGPLLMQLILNDLDTNDLEHESFRDEMRNMLEEVRKKQNRISAQLWGVMLIALGAVLTFGLQGAVVHP